MTGDAGDLAHDRHDAAPGAAGDLRRSAAGPHRALRAVRRERRSRARRSNREIADELFLGVETVKSHLRALFELFGVADLPQNRKRAELVRRAFETGVVRQG